jgi:hypothetical protein
MSSMMMRTASVQVRRMRIVAVDPVARGGRVSRAQRAMAQ